MTTKVKIKNKSRYVEGVTRPHDVKIETIDNGVITNFVILLPGQEADNLYVWEGRQYLITELENPKND